jgi:hypothetical protein
MESQIMNPKRALKNFLRGWLPKELSLPCSPAKAAEMKRREMAGWERKAFKITMIADGGMLATFLAAHWLVDSYTRSAEVSAVFWAVFVPTVILVNLLMYRHFKKRAHGGRE